jgi:glycosyltransferase involved in cell wall biosynthesis
MASGRAVVTTDAPGCRDAVVHGETGLLVPVRDPVALGAALLRLARDPGLVDAMGHAGRARAETVYDVDLVNRQLLHAMGLHRLDEAPAATAMQPRSSPAPAAREAA